MVVCFRVYIEIQRILSIGCGKTTKTIYSRHKYVRNGINMFTLRQNRSMESAFLLLKFSLHIHGNYNL